jgi:hypothetical protein
MKRRNLDDGSCLFCLEQETVEHLLFGCMVAQQVWCVVSECFNIPLISSYEQMAKCWLCNKKFGVTNMITLAVCWGLWKLRNALCF